ncbi:MAG TPA: nitroreductase/quinone reductase family protein [Acidimicrobiia bacterium]|nr:nitroreductase/quinone reductase family protein [Acidimicrobiia bacterium]
MDQGSYSRWARPAAKALARAHHAAYRATNGWLGARWRGAEVAWITTTGRRSGRRRTTPVVCLREQGQIAVVASNGGSDHAPDWWLNLQHDPRAEVEIARTRHAVWAQRAHADLEQRLATRFAQAFPRFEHYQRRTERDIPVVLLHTEPAAPTKRPRALDQSCNPVSYLAS